MILTVPIWIPWEKDAGQFELDEDPWDIFYWMLTVDYGEMSLEAQISWISIVIERIQNREYSRSEFNKKITQEKDNEA